MNKLKLTKAGVLDFCWELEKIKTDKYVKSFPENPKNFQWTTGYSEWLARSGYDGKQYGMFLKDTSQETINLYLINVPDSVCIWTLGFNFQWKRNPRVISDLDTWWNKNEKHITKLDDVLNAFISRMEEVPATEYATL